MTEDDVWALIEQARADAGSSDVTNFEQPSRALTRRLRMLTPEQIIQFALISWDVAGKAYRWEFHAAAYLINGEVSDDSFRDFTDALIGLGRDAFTEVLSSPDALADHPHVQAIASGQAARWSLSWEAISYAAAQAYESASASMEASFWDALKGLPGAPPGKHGTTPEWDGRFTHADVAQIRERLPRLHTLLAEGGQKPAQGSQRRRPQEPDVDAGTPDAVDGRCPRCDVPLNSLTTSFTSRDQHGEFTQVRQVRRCRHCQAVLWRFEGSDEWTVANDNDSEVHSAATMLDAISGEPAPPEGEA